MYHPTLEEFKELKKQGNLVPVYRQIDAEKHTPLSAFLKVKRGDYSFLLESVEGDERAARYSFIGTEPYRLVSTREGDKADPFHLIAEELAKHKLVPVSGLPDFCGGAVGYLAYETVRRFEQIPSPESDPLALPESVFMFVDTLLIFDHAHNKIKVVSHARADGDSDSAYGAAVAKIENLVKRLEAPPERPRPARAAPKPARPTETVSNLTRKEFEAVVAKAREYIVAGEAIQIVLSQRLSRRTSARPLDIYQALRGINPSPYMFFLNLKDFYIIGSSPEILLRAVDGTVTTRPIAGTRRRGKNPTEDAQLEEELRNAEKDRAEHMMLVDLGRSEIGRVSVPGTVKVSDLMKVERYSHVMHLVTNVEGKLHPDLSPIDALRACFPAGTVSGAPKTRAMEIIAELEPDKRGPYAGCVGHFSFSGNMDTAITIRTIVLANGIAHVQAGAGIIRESVPELEYEETLNKARALLKAIEEAEALNAT
ncbi:MAG TPA: anthranilate synthase component I [Dehalococcoidia bacterium]|nr:anthranilate synthase component I [Dehalococcoidia bacterium]